MTERTALTLIALLAAAFVALLLAPRLMQPEVQPSVPAWQEVAPRWQDGVKQPGVPPFPDPCELVSITCPGESE